MQGHNQGVRAVHREGQGEADRRLISGFQGGRKRLDDPLDADGPGRLRREVETDEAVAEVK